MALSYNPYTGDGASTDFNVTFPFISRDHVHATLDGVETTAFSWLSDSQIRFNAAPADAAAIIIKRVTPNDARLVDFANGSTLDAEADLDLDSNQMFYILQEAIDGTVSLSSSTDETNLAVTTDHFVAGSDFTAGSSTTVTLSAQPGSVDNTFVTFDGVVQHKSTYSLSGVTITFTSAIPIGVSQVEVVQFPSREFFYATLAAGSVSTSNIANLAVTTAKIADSNVTAAKLASDSVTTAKIADGAVTLAKLDATALAALLPLGVVLPYGGASAPSGWLFADGSAVSRTTYATLFALYGTAYGTGNGSTTFNLPDLRGRCPIGVGTGSGLTARALADSVGTETHSLDVTEIPSHSHQIGTNGTATTGDNSILRVNGSTDVNRSTGSTGGAGSSSSVGVGGTVVAHNNMQPSLALNFIIKAA